ncbi:DUF1918 domain-containing protein [Allostreptomyces psammosilenae]|uniref:DUF1918 domain-containing protein n=1 Tax=Allostreptomyces psammosilenae TaxID=1892865 RepID=A0A853A1C7_9ACTN|nr:DUF1918 domain-containing protein [Allostreptomyces psammosilenae]NYI08205.1 hypothetical protein [Allostreptomyces psammosilenae]
MTMQVSVGDTLVLHSHKVGVRERKGEVLEIRGEQSEGPYLVRFEDGHEALVFPGSDCTVEHPPAAGR